MKNSVIIKGNKYGIAIILDKEKAFDELKKDLAEKIKDSAKFFGKAQIAASFEGRKLTAEEEQEILDIISENSEMKVMCIVDMDSEKEKIYQQSLSSKLEDLAGRSGQFYKGTLRSGQVMESESSVVIMGDVNPGAKVVSKGNVIILGALKGTVFAGAAGNDSSFVAALEMDPMQIRIADIIARSSDKKRKKIDKQAKIAFVDDGYIYVEPLNRDVIKYIN